MPAEPSRLLDQDDRVVCERCAVADSFFTRLRGLLGRSELPRGEGLLLIPAPSVHTAFMRFPIDVVLLDRDLRVLAVREAVKPWRTAGARGAKITLELPAGEAARQGIEAGAQLRRVPA